MNLNIHKNRLRTISNVIVVKNVIKHRIDKQLMHANFYQLFKMSFTTNVSIKESAQTTIILAFKS